MKIMNDDIKKILTALVAGDAAGYVFEGMTKAHIKSVFRDLKPFPDPEAALKNNMHKWRKPGLYSSISQFMLLCGAGVDKKIWNRKNFLQMVKDSPELPGLDYSYFRNPDSAERRLILSLKNPPQEQAPPFNRPCSGIAPAAVPLLFLKTGEENLMTALLNYSLLFTHDPGTSAAAIALTFLLKDFINSDEKRDMLKMSIRSLEKTADFAEKHGNLIFESGVNPDYVIKKLRSFQNTLAETEGIEKIDDCEKAICSIAGKDNPSPVARASINLPEVLFPYALSIAARCKNPGDIFMTAAAEGGSSSALASIAGAIASAYYGDIVPDEILAGITNRKKLMTLIDIISTDKNKSSIFNELNSSEPPLTLKEAEEYNARNRKNPDKNQGKKPKTRKDAETEISKHIVESWTKIDKAKWKKERNKHKT